MMVSSEDNTPTGLVVRQRLSLWDRLAASDCWLYLASLCVIAIVAFVPVTPVSAAVCLLCAAYMLFDTFAPLPQALRRNYIFALQQKMIDGESSDFYRDLQTLVRGYMTIKEIAIAEHYSALLLKLSAGAEEQSQAKLNDVLAATPCRVIGPVSARGRLSLDTKELRFSAKNTSFEVDLADIRSVEIGHQIWWRARCSYLKLKYMQGGKEYEIWLTPSASSGKDNWFVNKNCLQWLDLIQSAKLKRGITRVMDNIRTSLIDVDAAAAKQNTNPAG